MNHMKKIFLFALLALVITNFYSQQVVDNKFGKGIYHVIAKDSSYSMKFAIRMQSLYMSEWNVNDSSGIGHGESNFLVRRARLKFGGFAYSPKLVYKVELGLTNRDISGGSVHTKNAPRVILDAIVKWNFYKNFVLWAGQTKLPGNRERVVSSANLEFVDRSLLNKNFNIDRDMGMQLRHHFTLGNDFVVREMFSFAQGEGRNITEGNLGGYQYTSRIELLPFGKFKSKGDYTEGDLQREETPKLALGATYDFHDRAVKDKSNQGKYMTNDAGYFETDISTVFVDAMFKYKGVSLLGEYANRTAQQDSVMNSDGTTTGQVVKVGNGMNIQVGYLLGSNWEIAGRYTSIALDKNVTGKDKNEQYTLGVSKYIVGHKLKIQSDISYLTVDNSVDSKLLYRLQFDLHF